MKWFILGMAFMWSLDVYGILTTEAIGDFISTEVRAIAESIVANP